MPEAAPRRLGLVVAPGASATRDHPSLLAIERVATAVGVEVQRTDLPRGKAERAVPAACAAAESLRRRVDGVVLGGRSFGGRVFSLAVSGGFPAAGLVLVSYPLHPPGRPADLRTEHFARLSVPCLFVSGTRDAFATPAELENATADVAGPVTHVWIDGGDHGLRGRDDEVATTVGQWLKTQAERPPG